MLKDIGPAPLLIAFLAMDEEELDQYIGNGPLVTDNDAYFLPHADETDQIMTAVRKSVGEE